MTFSEALETWKEKSNKSNLGNLCDFGDYDGRLGFCGCKHSKHPDVTYSGEFCPKNCPEFSRMLDSQLYSRFRSHYIGNEQFYENLTYEESDKFRC